MAHGTVVLPSSKPPHRERFETWAKELKALYKEHKPDLVVVEELHVDRNLNTMKILCGLLTMTVVTLPKKARIVMCHQGTAKKDVVKPYIGRAKLNKEDVFKWATETYKLRDFKFKNQNDVTDAILVAHWALNADLTESG